MSVYKEICNDYPYEHAQILRYGQFRFREERNYYALNNNSRMSDFGCTKKRLNRLAKKTSRDVLRDEIKKENKVRMSTLFGV